jgi:hypothetical protein
MVNLALAFKLILDMRFLELKLENTWVKNDCPIWQLSDEGTAAFWQTKPSKISGIDRLALVSKAFMDTVFLELKRVRLWSSAVSCSGRHMRDKLLPLILGPGS